MHNSEPDKKQVKISGCQAIGYQLATKMFNFLEWGLEEHKVPLLGTTKRYET